MGANLKNIFYFWLLLTIVFGSISKASQHDYVISNDTGANVRADINSALIAGQSNNSGTTAPVTMYAFQFWMDTFGGTPILKMRNAANSAWISIGDASLTGFGLLDRTGGTVSGELILSATNDVKIPVGTTAQRNGTPVNGQIRYNSDNKVYEGYHESQFSSFQREVANPDYASNYSLTATVASSALTISLKNAAGANAAAGDPAGFAFRSATLASGDNSLVKLTGSLSGVVASGATLGHTNAVENPIFVGVLNNAGTLELCWSTTPWDEGERITTTAAGAGSTSASLIYSTSARTNVASKIVGKLLSTQTTAGTWAAVPTNISSGSAPLVRAWLPPTVQRFTSGSGTYTLPVAPRKPIYITVEMVGGGGGGGGGNNNTAGTNGGNTTFASITANGGGGGACANVSNSGGSGGAATVSTGVTLAAVDGQIGGAAQSGATSAVSGVGGNSVFGGGGASVVTQVGSTAKSNSGSGGSGGSTSAVTNAGHGGGAGAYAKSIITSPSATYSYAVGAFGSGASAGTNGFGGGNGGAGLIIVTEYYQ